MKPFVIAILILSSILRLQAANYCENIIELPEKWTQDNCSVQQKCCEITDSQWSFIVWYFLRVSSNINVTQIVRESETSCHNERYVNHFISDLYKYTGLEYFLKRIIFGKSDEILDEKQKIWVNTLYEWHGKADEKPGNKSYPGNKFYFRNKYSTWNRVREDEPRYGNVILVSDVQLMDDYLDGITRYPFDSKQSHFVIFIYGGFDINQWDDFSSSIMTKLWKKYGILDAIILAACNPIRVSSTCSRKKIPSVDRFNYFSCFSTQVGIYDPFENTQSLNVFEPHADEWGIYLGLPIEDLDSRDSWILQKEYTMNGFPITVSIFDRYPTMVKEIPKYFAPTEMIKAIRKSGYAGYDGFVLGNLATLMDFTVNVISPADKKTYGFKENDTFTGTLGDIIYRRAEIAFNSRFLISYESMDIRFMVPIICDQVCVIVPAGRTTPKWQAIIKCFDSYFWFTSILIILFTSIIYTLVKFYHEKHEMELMRDTIFYKDFRNVIVEDKITIKHHVHHTLIWCVMFGRVTILPQLTIERLIIGSCMIANIIIAGSLQSSLYELYTQNKPKNLNTLEELDASGLRITASSPTFRDVFGNNQDSSAIFESLKGKLFLEHTDLSAVERVAAKGGIGTLERLSDVKIMLLVKCFQKLVFFLN